MILRLQIWALRTVALALVFAAIAFQAWQLAIHSDWSLLLLSGFVLSIGLHCGLLPKSNQVVRPEVALSSYQPSLASISAATCFIAVAIGLLLRTPWLAGTGAVGLIWIRHIDRIDRKYRWLILLGAMFFCSPTQKQITSLVGLRPQLQSIQSLLLDSCGIFHSQAVDSYIVYASDRILDLNTLLVFCEWTLISISCALISRAGVGFVVSGCMIVGSLLPVALHKLLISLVAVFMWPVPLGAAPWTAMVHSLGFAMAFLWIMNTQRMIASLDNWIRRRANRRAGTRPVFDWKTLATNSALPLFATLAICGCILHCPPKESLDRSYGEQFVKLVESEQFSAAASLLPRLAAGSIDYSDSIFRIAGRHIPSQTSMAIKIIEASRQRGLIDDQCYLWLANQLLACKDRDSSVKKLADRYYEVARKMARQDATSTMGLVQYCLATDRLQEAISLLKSSHFDAPQDQLSAVRFLYRNGESHSAISAAEMLERTLKDSIGCEESVDEVDLSKIRLLTEVYLIQYKIDEAIQLLDQSREQLRATELDELLISVLLLKCRSERLTQPAEVEVLNRIYSLNRQHQGFLEYCAKRLFQPGVEDDTELAKLCRNVITGLLKDKHTNPEICLIVGTGLATQGKFELANRYLTFALDHGTATEVLLNNLAWVRLKLDASNASDSLEMVNRALQINSRSISSLRTRAEINELLGNISEAISDLESVNQLGAPDRSVRNKISELYRKAGAEATAQAYEKSAQSICRP